MCGLLRQSTELYAPKWVKALSQENFWEELPVHLVIRLLKIQFENDTLLLLDKTLVGQQQWSGLWLLWILAVASSALVMVRASVKALHGSDHCQQKRHPQVSCSFLKASP
jgi:hypothetical protein